MEPQAIGYSGGRKSIEKVSIELDLIIKQVPNGLLKKPYILLSKSNYEKLCIELKRNVRTYKGYKVRSM